MASWHSGAPLPQGHEDARDNARRSGRRDAGCFSDADWAEDWADRRSTTGYVVLFRGTAVSWGAIKQKTVALSTAEAEYMALTETIKDVTWVTSILGDFGVTAQKGPITVYCDNQAAIALANNPGHHRSSKHIDIRYHYIRENVLSGFIDLHYCRTSEQMADIFTKGLDGPTHWVHATSMGVQAKKSPIAHGGTILVAMGVSTQGGSTEKYNKQSSLPTTPPQPEKTHAKAPLLAARFSKPIIVPALALRMGKPTLASRMTAKPNLASRMNRPSSLASRMHRSQDDKSVAETSWKLREKGLGGERERRRRVKDQGRGNGANMKLGEEARRSDRGGC